MWGGGLGPGAPVTGTRPSASRRFWGVLFSHYFLWASFCVDFLFVFGSFLGVILGHFWSPNRSNNAFTVFYFCVFLCVFSIVFVFWRVQCSS